jgi:hypothetical protein
MRQGLSVLHPFNWSLKLSWCTTRVQVISNDTFLDSFVVRQHNTEFPVFYVWVASPGLGVKNHPRD